MSYEVKKIRIDWPVTLRRSVAHPFYKKLCEAAPFFKKILERFPHGFQERIFTEDYTVTERIFEKMFCLYQIGKYEGRISKILDIGCWSSDLVIQMANYGFKVWGIDGQEYHMTHPNFTFVSGDIRKPPFEEGEFDLITAISTVEHIGLGHYLEQEEPEGDIESVKEMYRLLKPGGLLILTVPYGQFMQTPVFRVYDEERLTRLIGDFKILEQQFRINHSDEYWEVTTKAVAAQQTTNDRDRNNGNVCMVLEKAV